MQDITDRLLAVLNTVGESRIESAAVGQSPLRRTRSVTISETRDGEWRAEEDSSQEEGVIVYVVIKYHRENSEKELLLIVKEAPRRHRHVLYNHKKKKKSVCARHPDRLVRDRGSEERPVEVGPRRIMCSHCVSVEKFWLNAGDSHNTRVNGNYDKKLQ